MSSGMAEPGLLDGVTVVPPVVVIVEVLVCALGSNRECVNNGAGIATTTVVRSDAVRDVRIAMVGVVRCNIRSLTKHNSVSSRRVLFANRPDHTRRADSEVTQDPIKFFASITASHLRL